LEIVLACLLHDTVQALVKPDDGWWGAQLYEPYVSEKVTFAIHYQPSTKRRTHALFLRPDL
jgi:hypothetical protein